MKITIEYTIIKYQLIRGVVKLFLTKTLPVNSIICGDCEDVLKGFPDNSIDLIITSPPYVDQRKGTYGGIRPDKMSIGSLKKQNNF